MQQAGKTLSDSLFSRLIEITNFQKIDRESNDSGKTNELSLILPKDIEKTSHGIEMSYTRMS